MAMTRLAPSDRDIKQLWKEYFQGVLCEAMYDCADRRDMISGIEPRRPSLDPYGFVAMAEREYGHIRSLAATYEFTPEQKADAIDLLSSRNFEAAPHEDALARLFMEADIEAKRINVSAAFFLSIEFQQTGYFVYRIYKAAYGNLSGAPVPLKLSEYLLDMRQIGQGVIVNQTGWERCWKTTNRPSWRSLCSARA